MRTPPATPVLPAHLLDRLGQPEDSFGPNWRFRTASAVAGAGVTLLGVGFVLAGVTAISTEAPNGG
jgi:hypothetical protein